MKFRVFQTPSCYFLAASFSGLVLTELGAVSTSSIASTKGILGSYGLVGFAALLLVEEGSDMAGAPTLW
jgi:hypothetical protein